MIDFEPFHYVIQDRITNPNANYYEPYWWEKEIKQFTIDLSTSIRFIEEACTDEELYWLGEIFDDLMEKTRSKEFLDCLRVRVETVSNPEWKALLQEEINTAATYIAE